MDITDSSTKDIMYITKCDTCDGDEFFHYCGNKKHLIAHKYTKEEDRIKIKMCENCKVKDFNFHTCNEGIHDHYGKEFKVKQRKMDEK